MKLQLTNFRQSYFDIGSQKKKHNILKFYILFKLVYWSFLCRYVVIKILRFFTIR